MAGTSTCQTIYNIGGGQHFVLQNVYSGEYLSAVSTNPLQQISSSLTDSRLWFTYDTSTMRIASTYAGLCLDDQGHGYSSSSSTSDTLALTTCSTSPTQQFVYQPSTSYLLNPNNAYDKCIDGNSAFSALFLWSCPDGTANHQWTVVLVCSPGELSQSFFSSPNNDECRRLLFSQRPGERLHSLSGRHLLHRLRHHPLMLRLPLRWTPSCPPRPP